MHRELIPREISIVRCYYEQEVVAPGTSFGFDINGSGFTEAFYRIIQVDADALDIQVRDLRLVTANQIHGVMDVGADATTQYVHPKVLIRGLPVFRAPDPFGVVRHGDVLDIVLVSIDETGQSGHFDVITNLEPADVKRFRVVPSTDKLEIAQLTPRLPFHIDGLMQIAPGLSNGHYGLTAYMGSHELKKKEPLVDVVRPNVGRSGSIDNLKAIEPAHRPNDAVQIALRGSGFTAGDTRLLTARVSPFSVESSTFSFVSGGRMDLTVHLPGNIPVGVYGVTVFHKGKEIYNQKAVFLVVLPNWLGGIRLAQPVGPGRTGKLLIQGREISQAFVSGLQVAVEEPGLRLSPLRLQDPSTIVADIEVDSSVAPGDYLVHLTSQGKALQLSRGNIIKITP